MKKIYKNKRSELEMLCQDISTFGSEFLISEKDLFTLHLVIEEIFVNIVDYGFDDRKEHPIEVELSFSDGVTIIIITDSGKPFNPLTDVQAPNLGTPLATRQTGGLGIHFMKQMMDQIDYQRMDNQNILIMSKEVKCEASHGPKSLQ